MAKKRKTGGIYEDAMIDKLDKLAEFDDFCARILPALRKDLADDSISVEALRLKYLKVAQAAQIMELANPDKRLAAAKDLIDRVEGKATEKVVHEHKFRNLKTEQLQSVLKSKLASLNRTEDEESTESH